MLLIDRPRLRLASAPLMTVLVVAAACSSSKGHATDAGDDCCGDAEAKTDGKTTHDAGHDAKASSGSGTGESSGTGTGTGCTSCEKDSGPAPRVDSGHDAAQPTAPLGTHTEGVMINVPTVTGTVVRTYDITLPATCDSSHLVPLVFVFHGDGGNGNDMYTGFPIEAAASTAGGTAIFVYPDGTNNNIDPDGAARAWDLYHDPGAPPYTYTPGHPVPAMSDEASGNVDVDFFDTMLETFEKEYCVDKSKVWITGMSSGGFLANQFARWRTGVIKATAPQSGAMPFGQGPPDGDSLPGTWSPPNYCISTLGAVPAIIIHGLDDTTVDPCFALEEESYWDTANGCAQSANNCGTSGNSCSGSNFTIPAPAPTTTSTLNADCKQTSGCGSNPVVLCQIPNWGHNIWLPEGPQVIWSFFSAL